METTKKKIAEAAALSRLANLCAKAEYCVSDIRQKMARWDLPEGAEDRIVHRLLNERYIDEQRYACAFVRSKFRFNRWGRVVYHSKDYHNDWDGGGLSDGTYFYVLKCHGLKQDATYQGSVMIIKTQRQ